MLITRHLLYIYSGTFFTLKHTLVDISKQLYDIYESVDATRIEEFASEVCYDKHSIMYLSYC
mgnify:CR=1 FL=1